MPNEYRERIKERMKEKMSSNNPGSELKQLKNVVRILSFGVGDNAIDGDWEDADRSFTEYKAEVNRFMERYISEEGRHYVKEFTGYLGDALERRDESRVVELSLKLCYYIVDSFWMWG